MGSCKSNYNIFTTTTAPLLSEVLLYLINVYYTGFLSHLFSISPISISPIFYLTQLYVRVDILLECEGHRHYLIILLRRYFNPANFIEVPIPRQDLIWFLVFNVIISYIMVTSFSGGRSRSTRREPPTMGKHLVNFITCGCLSSAPFFVIYKAGRKPMLLTCMSC